MNKDLVKKNQNKIRRANRTRARIHGTAERPRLSVFRSAKHIHAQLINDDAGTTIAASSDAQVKSEGKKPVEVAALVGTDVATKAKAAGIETVIFDRGAYKYHGRVQALADAARDAGLAF